MTIIFPTYLYLKPFSEYSIAACGTARPNSLKYPRILKYNKHTSHLPWNTLSGIVLNDVLAIVWQDKNVVRFLTTYHECTGKIRILLFAHEEDHNLLLMLRGN